MGKKTKLTILAAILIASTYSHNAFELFESFAGIHDNWIYQRAHDLGDGFFRIITLHIILARFFHFERYLRGLFLGVFSVAFIDMMQTIAATVIYLVNGYKYRFNENVYLIEILLYIAGFIWAFNRSKIKKTRKKIGFRLHG